MSGYVFVFEIQKHFIKKDIKKLLLQYIPTGKLTVIKISPVNKNALIWTDLNEFRYKGIMYDIVKKENLNNGIINYYCITDNYETELFAKFDDYINNNIDRQSKNNSLFKNLFKLLTIQYLPSQKIRFTFSNNFQKLDSSFTFLYFPPGIKPQTPPPKYI
ncbi:MAG: hypothetical protein COX07_07330 [Bacteroidetes bacterium CG23_combo_of_CG06-09_8_20_14_all_32_9]|nr:MAG: hypothetical protein COX07_07330 [Bacteroidetes bacterium CG23_combo_of_CG06-09_8_20_14_all_32_9]